MSLTIHVCCVRVHKSNIWWSGNTFNLHEILPEFITNIIYSSQIIHIMPNTNLSKNLYHLLRSEKYCLCNLLPCVLCTIFDCIYIFQLNMYILVYLASILRVGVVLISA